MMGTKITDKTLGLFGMGRIAQAMAQKAHFGFRMKIIFYDPYFNDEETIKKFNAVKCENIDELLVTQILFLFIVLQQKKLKE